MLAIISNYLFVSTLLCHTFLFLFLEILLVFYQDFYIVYFACKTVNSHQIIHSITNNCTTQPTYTHTHSTLYAYTTHLLKTEDYINIHKYNFNITKLSTLNHNYCSSTILRTILKYIIQFNHLTIYTYKLLNVIMLNTIVNFNPYIR